MVKNIFGKTIYRGKRVISMMLVFLMIFTLCDWSVFVPVKADTSQFSAVTIDKNFVTVDDSLITVNMEKTDNTYTSEYKYSLDSNIQVNADDIYNNKEAWSTITSTSGMLGKWVLDSTNGVITNQENTDQLTGYYFKNGSYKTMKFSFDAISTNGDNDGMGCMFNLVSTDSDNNGTADVVSSYVLFCRGSDTTASHPNVPSGLYKIKNGKFDRANITPYCNVCNKALTYSNTTRTLSCATDSTHTLANGNFTKILAMPTLVNGKNPLDWTMGQSSTGVTSSTVWEKYDIEVTEVSNGLNIKIYKDGVLYINYTDTDPLGAGTYGFFSVSQPQAHFKNFKVYSDIDTSTSTETYEVETKNLDGGNHTIYILEELYSGNTFIKDNLTTLPFYKNYVPKITLSTMPSVVNLSNGKNLSIVGNLSDKEVDGEISGQSQTYKSFTYAIKNSSGTTKLNGNITAGASFSKSIDVSSLPAGTYTLYLSVSDGSDIGTYEKTFKIRKNPSITVNSYEKIVTDGTDKIVLNGSINNFNGLSFKTAIATLGSTNYNLTMNGNNFSVEVPLTKGAYNTITIKVVDNENYTSSEDVEIYRNTKPSLEVKYGETIWNVNETKPIVFDMGTSENISVAIKGSYTDVDMGVISPNQTLSGEYYIFYTYEEPNISNTSSILSSGSFVNGNCTIDLDTLKYSNNLKPGEYTILFEINDGIDTISEIRQFKVTKNPIVGNLNYVINGTTGIMDNGVLKLKDSLESVSLNITGNCQTFNKGTKLYYVLDNGTPRLATLSSVDGGSDFNENYTFNINLNIEYGEHTIEVYTKDSLDKISNKQILKVYRNDAPEMTNFSAPNIIDNTNNNAKINFTNVTISDVNNDFTSNSVSYVISGTKFDGTSIKKEGVTTISSNNFVVDISTLDAGKYTIIMNLKDDFGDNNLNVIEHSFEIKDKAILIAQIDKEYIQSTGGEVKISGRLDNFINASGTIKINVYKNDSTTPITNLNEVFSSYTDSFVVNKNETVKNFIGSFNFKNDINTYGKYTFKISFSYDDSNNNSYVPNIQEFIVYKNYKPNLTIENIDSLIVLSENDAKLHVDGIVVDYDVVGLTQKETLSYIIKYGNDIKKEGTLILSKNNGVYSFNEDIVLDKTIFTAEAGNYEIIFTVEDNFNIKEKDTESKTFKIRQSSSIIDVKFTSLPNDGEYVLSNNSKDLFLKEKVSNFTISGKVNNFNNENGIVTYVLTKNDGTTQTFETLKDSSKNSKEFNFERTFDIDEGFDYTLTVQFVQVLSDGTYSSNIETFTIHRNDAPEIYEDVIIGKDNLNNDTRFIVLGETLQVKGTVKDYDAFRNLRGQDFVLSYAIFGNNYKNVNEENNTSSKGNIELVKGTNGEYTFDKNLNLSGFDEGLNYTIILTLEDKANGQVIEKTSLSKNFDIVKNSIVSNIYISNEDNISTNKNIVISNNDRNVYIGGNLEKFNNLLGHLYYNVFDENGNEIVESKILGNTNYTVDDNVSNGINFDFRNLINDFVDGKGYKINISFKNDNNTQEGYLSNIETVYLYKNNLPKLTDLVFSKQSDIVVNGQTITSPSNENGVLKGKPLVVNGKIYDREVFDDLNTIYDFAEQKLTLTYTIKGENYMGTTISNIVGTIGEVNGYDITSKNPESFTHTFDEVSNLDAGHYTIELVLSDGLETVTSGEIKFDVKEIPKLTNIDLSLTNDSIKGDTLFVNSNVDEIYVSGNYHKFNDDLTGNFYYEIIDEYGKVTEADKVLLNVEAGTKGDLTFGKTINIPDISKGYEINIYFKDVEGFRTETLTVYLYRNNKPIIDITSFPIRTYSDNIDTNSININKTDKNNWSHKGIYEGDEFKIIGKITDKEAYDINLDSGNYNFANQTLTVSYKLEGFDYLGNKVSFNGYIIKNNEVINDEKVTCSINNDTQKVGTFSCIFKEVSTFKPGTEYTLSLEVVEDGSLKEKANYSSNFKVGRNYDLTSKVYDEMTNTWTQMLTLTNGTIKLDVKGEITNYNREQGKVYYQINNDIPVFLANVDVPLKDSKNVVVEYSGVITGLDTLGEGDQVVYIYFLGNDGYISNIETITLHKNAKPNLSNISLSVRDNDENTTTNGEIRFNEGAIVTINGTVKDSEEGKLNAYYTIKDSNGKVVSNHNYLVINKDGEIIINNDNKGKEIDLSTVLKTIDTKNLPYGDYTLELTIFDTFDGLEYDYVTENVNFKVNYAPEIIETHFNLATSDTYENGDNTIRVNQGTTIWVNGQIEDNDSDYVKFKYSIDNGEWIYFKDVNDIDADKDTNEDYVKNNTSSTKSPFNVSFETNTLKEGTHKIRIKAEDALMRESDVITEMEFLINYVPTYGDLKVARSDKDIKGYYLKVNQGQTATLFLEGVTDKNKDDVLVEYIVLPQAKDVSINKDTNKVEINNWKKLEGKVIDGKFQFTLSAEETAKLKQGENTVYVRIYDVLRDTLKTVDGKEYPITEDKTVYDIYDKSVKAISLRINVEPNLSLIEISETSNDGFVSVDTSRDTLNTLKVSRKGTVYIKGKVYDIDNEVVDIFYDIKTSDNKTYEKIKLITINNASSDANNFISFETSFNVEQYVTGKAQVSIYAIDQEGQKGYITERPFELYINNIPQITEPSMIIGNGNKDEGWNGAIYRKEAKDNFTTAKYSNYLTFKVNDKDYSSASKDAYLCDDLTYTIYIDNVPILEQTKKASAIISGNGTCKIDITNISELLASVIDNNSSIIKIKLTDGRDTVYTEINKDVFGHGLSVRTNHKPIVQSFSIKFDDLTGKNIYDMLMLNQKNKPTFEWIANESDSTYGDIITTYLIQYSINNTDWIDLNDSFGTDVSSFEWLNNTGLTKTRATFRIIATDKFGVETISTFGTNDNIFLQREERPGTPSYLTITNSEFLNYFVDKDYLFGWGASIDTNIYDAIDEYVFGYMPGTSISVSDLVETNPNTKELTYKENVLYHGTNLISADSISSSEGVFNFRKMVSEDVNQVTFGVFSVDKFGEKSPIRTLTVIFSENDAPNKVTINNGDFKDKTSNTLSQEEGYIKKGESYLLSWTDAGDPNTKTNDKVNSWIVYYRNPNNVDKDWKVLAETKINEFSFTFSNFDENIVNELVGTLEFAIIAVDTFGATSEEITRIEKGYELKYVTDDKGPTLSNKDSFLNGTSSKNGQLITLKIKDDSAVNIATISLGGNEVAKYEGENLVKGNDGLYSIDYLVKYNGVYTLYLKDIYGNESSIPLEITTIDLTAPIINVVPGKENNELTNTSFDINLNLYDNQKLANVKVTRKSDGEVIIDKKLTKQSEIVKLTVTENDTFVIVLVDTSLNESSSTYTVTNIWKEKPIINTDYYDNKELAPGETTFKVTATVNKNGLLNYGSWEVLGYYDEDGKLNKVEGNISTKTSSDGKELTITVKNNGGYKFTFTDVWGNKNDEFIVQVDNILDTNIKTKIQYLVGVDEYVNFNNISYEAVEKIEIKTKDYYNPNLEHPYQFVEIAEADAKNNNKYTTIYAFATIDEEYREFSEFINYLTDEANKVELIYENDDSNNKPYQSLFRFSENKKNINFFIKDIFGSISSVRATATTATTPEAEISYKIVQKVSDGEYVEVLGPVNSEVDVIVWVENGYFFENDSFYQYMENDEIKYYYDSFIWGDLSFSNNNIYFNENDSLNESSKEKERKAFIFHIKENINLKVWALNDAMDTYSNEDVIVGCIDKEPPTIEVSNYEDLHSFKSIIIEAYTRDTFFTANELITELKKIYPENEVDALDIYNNYKVDGNYAYMTFTRNTTSFKFFAKDTVNNIAESEQIRLTNAIVNCDTTFVLSYKDDTNNWVEILGTNDEITKWITANLKRNNNLEIRLLVNNGKFLAEDNYSSMVSNGGTYLDISIPENGEYTFVARDNTYNLEVLYKLNIVDTIDRTLPILTIDKDNYSVEGSYIDTVEVSVSANKNGTYVIKNNNGDIIFNQSKVKDEVITFIAKENGSYKISFTDIYGNNIIETIEITEIISKNDSPIITVSDYPLISTKGPITITLSVEKGLFFDDYLVVKSGKVDSILNNDKNLVTLTFSENAEVVVTAKNYYEESPISETIAITNIDSIAPSAPSYEIVIDEQGLLQFKFKDNGTNVDGVVVYDVENINYKLYQVDTNNVETYKAEGRIKINKALSIPKNKVTGNAYKDGEIKLDIFSLDAAENSSEVVTNSNTIYSDDEKVKAFNTFYESSIEQIKLAKAIKDDEVRQEKLRELKESNDLAIEDIETSLYDGTYKNELQISFVQDKINALRILLDEEGKDDSALLDMIEGYFDRLERDITDNAFMNELAVLISSVDDADLRAQYKSRYDYYASLIAQLFTDTTSDEFSYVDSNGNTINPLSGYVLNGKIYGTYDAAGMFIAGKVDRNYYYMADGTKVELDDMGNTYVDGIKNVVNVHSGAINEDDGFYDIDGNIVKVRPANGFYDFEGRWHERQGLPEIKDETDKPGEGGDTPGGDTPGGDTPGGGEEVIIEPTSITLSETSIELIVGEAKFVTYTIGPADARETIVTWTTTNSSVARVSNGNIIAIDEGVASIIATTDNGISALVQVVVNKASTGSGTDEDITVVPPEDEYPDIDDVFPPDVPDEPETPWEAEYEPIAIGDLKFAFMTKQEMNNANFDKVIYEGYSTVIMKENGSIDSNLINKAKETDVMDIGIGNENAMLILSYKDIYGSVSGFGFTDNKDGTFKVSISGKSTLGNNSVLMIGADKNAVLYYNGNIISTTYSDELGCIILYNPLPGNYKVGLQGTSIYTYLNKYGFSSEVTGKLTYADVISLCYNCLQKDNFGKLYSNIEETSDVYRQASILQKYGILGKDANISDSECITGIEAYDLVFLTLSNKINGDLNYDTSDFDVDYVTLNTLNNIVMNITVIEY